MRWITAGLIVLLGVFLFYVSQPGFLKKVSDFSAADWAVMLSIPSAVIGAHFFNRYNRHKRLNSRDILWLFIALVTVVVISALAFYVRSDTGIAIVLASYFASLGWIYTNYANANIQRKAHTMNVLVQLRNSAEFNKHRGLVLAKFPFGRPVSINDMIDLKAERALGGSYVRNKVPVLDSVYYIVNYFEFMSIGVMNGDLDDTMIEHTYRSIFVNWFHHLEPIIHDAQVEQSGVRNERIFRGYIALVRRYKDLPK